METVNTWFGFVKYQVHVNLVGSCSVMMSSPSPNNGAQDLHENLLCSGDAAFPGLSNQNELTETELSL